MGGEYIQRHVGGKEKVAEASRANGTSHRLSLDGAIVPAMLLLVGRELALYDPPRELAWQLFHDLKDTPKPAWLAAFLPQPAPVLYDDPVALLLAAAATGLAAAYGVLALTGKGARARATLIVAAALVLVALPTVAFIALSLATGRPYGHDGGVVQLPLALDRVLSGLSPYGADYSASVLGWQSRSSVFWAPLGGNPIVRHHWYLPGVHLAMAIPYVLCRRLFGFFDPRLVTLAAYGLAIVLITRLVTTPEKRLVAAALVALNPLIFWPQIFGTNDVMSAVPLLLGALLATRGRPDAAAAMLGVACAFKQLAWPFAPFLLAHLADVASLKHLATRDGLRRLRRPALIAVGVFTAIVLPVAALDLRAFVGDIFRYQVGSPGSEQYPLGGTPGFGFANLLIYAGRVATLSDYFPFQRFYLLFIPIGLVLLRYQLGRRTLGSAFVCGSAALLVSLYFSRIVNPNYLILAAIFLPLGVLMDGDRRTDIAVVPLLLLLLGVEIAYHEPLRTTWDQAQAAGVDVGLPAWLAPSPAGPRWRDPLSMGASGALAGLGIVYLLLGIGGAPRSVRLGLITAGGVLGIALPALVISHVGLATGTRRAQDPWYVAALRSQEALGPGAWADRPGHTPTPVLEAWSMSWRRDPPRPIAETPPSPLTFALGRSLRRVAVDPRLLTVLAMVVAAALATGLVAREQGTTIGAVLTLCPVCALGVVFGAGEMIPVALVIAAGFLVRRSGVRVAAMTLGLGLLAAILPLLVLFPGEFVRWVLAARPLSPGMGLSNLLYYRPGQEVAGMALLRGAAPILLGLLALMLLRSTRARAMPWALLGTITAAALVLLPSVPAPASAVPIVLLAMASLAEPPNPGRPGATRVPGS
jgi:hypothetical protein